MRFEHVGSVWEKTVGEGDVENRLMTTAASLRLAVNELHGDGVLGNDAGSSIKVLEAQGASGFGEGTSGVVQVEEGTAYISGYRVSYDGAFKNVPTPYVQVEDEIVSSAPSAGQYELQYEDVVDDGSFIAYKYNASTGARVALSRYSEYTLDAPNGKVTLFDDFGAEEELRCKYRFRVPGLFFVELDIYGELFIAAGTSVSEDDVDPNGDYVPGGDDDPYMQVAYQGYLALPPSDTATGRILLAKLYYPGPKAKPYRNMEEDEDRGLSGLTDEEIATGNYALIDDERRILTPAEDLLDFQQAFYQMLEDMNNAVAKADAAMEEIYLRGADLDGEGIVTGFEPTPGVSMGLTVSAGTAYIEKHLSGGVDWLMRVAAAQAQACAFVAPTDDPDENQTLQEYMIYSSSTSDYTMTYLPVMKLLLVGGEVLYKYIEANPDLLTKRLSDTFTTSKPTSKPSEANYDANCTALTVTERAKLGSADAVTVINSSSAEDGEHSLHVFKAEHGYTRSNINKINYRWDGTGDGGAELFIFNWDTDEWESLGTATTSITQISGQISSNVLDYVGAGGDIYLAAASANAASGGASVDVESDYAYIWVTSGVFNAGDIDQAEPVPTDNYELTDDSKVHFKADKFAYPTPGTNFWAQYYQALPRYALMQLGLDGVVDVKTGTPSASPQVPAMDEEHVRVGWVLIRRDGAIVDEESATLSDNVLYVRRQVIWTGDEGIDAREDADSLVENIRMRTYELHGNVVASGCQVQAYPTDAGSSQVYITSGVYYAQGRRREYAGGFHAYSFGSCAEGFHRLDIFYMDEDGVTYALQGTTVEITEVAEAPSLPSDMILLAYIYMTNELVGEERVPASSITDARSWQGTGNDDAPGLIPQILLTYFNELGGDGLIVDDTIIDADDDTTPSRSVYLDVGSTGIAYIDGQRVVLDNIGEPSRHKAVLKPVAIRQHPADGDTYHPFVALDLVADEPNSFNVWSHYSPIEGLQFPLQSIRRIEADAWCDHTLRRPRSDAHTNIGWHLSYSTLAVDPESLPGAAQEFTDAGFESNGEPVLNDEDETYQNMFFSDGVTSESESAVTSGEYIMHIFGFRHIENNGTISKIKVRWEGCGERPVGATTEYGAALSIWNGSSWEELANYDDDNLGTDVEMALEGELTSDLNDYVQADGYIYVRAHCTYTANGINGALMRTDFVTVWVQEDGRWMVPNHIFNGHFEYGTGAPYGWEVVLGAITWDASEGDTTANANRWWKDWDWLYEIDTAERTLMDAGFANDPRSKCLAISNSGSQLHHVRQRFSIDQDSGEAFSKRPLRLSFDYWRNITVGGEDAELSVRLRLWTDDNVLELDHTITLPVGSGTWQEVTYDYMPTDYISHGEVLIVFDNKTGTVKFDNFALIGVPEAAHSGGAAYDIDIEHDYEVGLDRVDWTPSGFDPVDGVEYDVTYRHWGKRTDSCQISAGTSFAVYEGVEGADGYPPALQTRSLEMARIVLRGDRPIKDADDGWCSYLVNLHPLIFTGTEGALHREQITEAERGLGQQHREAIYFGLAINKKSATEIEVGPGMYRTERTDMAVREWVDVGSPAGEGDGYYYCCAEKNQYNEVDFGWYNRTAGWPDKPVIFVVEFDDDGDTFGAPIDLRHLSQAPPAAQGLDALAGHVYGSNVAVHSFNLADVYPPAPPYMYPITIGNQRLTISWAASGDTSVVGYRLYRSLDNSAYSLIATISGTSYNDTGLTNGTTYWYKVACYTADGRESDVSSLTDPATNSYNQPQNAAPSASPAPSAPTGLTATPGNQQVVLNWVAVTRDVAGGLISGCQYIVYRSCVQSGGGSAGPWTRVNASLISGTTYTDTGLTNGYTYWYCVSAVRLSVEGDKSSAVSAIPSGIALEDRPLAPSFTVKGGEVIGTADEWSNNESISNLQVKTDSADGVISIVRPDMVPLAFDWDTYNLPLGFFPDVASLDLLKVWMADWDLREATPYDYYGYYYADYFAGGSYPNYYTYKPYEEMSFGTDGNVFADDIYFDSDNGQWWGEYIGTGDDTGAGTGTQDFYVLHPPMGIGSARVWLVPDGAGDVYRCVKELSYWVPSNEDSYSYIRFGSRQRPLAAEGAATGLTKTYTNDGGKTGSIGFHNNELGIPKGTEIEKLDSQFKDGWGSPLFFRLGWAFYMWARQRTITSATLRLRLTMPAGISPNPVDLTLYEVIKEVGDQATLTTSYVDPTPICTMTRSLVSGSTYEYSANIATYLEAWKTGAKRNMGFIVTQNGNVSISFTITSNSFPKVDYVYDVSAHDAEKIYVEYQTPATKEGQLTYTPTTVHHVRNLQTGLVVPSSEYEITGKKITFIDSQPGAVRVVYAPNMSEVSNMVRQGVQTWGSLPIKVYSDEEWQLDIGWSANDDGYLTLDTGQTAGTANYVLDAGFSGATWDKARFIYKLGSGGGTIQFRYRAAETEGGLTGEPWSPLADLASEVSISDTGRYLEVEFQFANCEEDTDQVNRAHFRTQQVYVSWTPVTLNELGATITCDAYHVRYLYSDLSAAGISEDIVDTSFTYNPRDHDNMWFSVQAQSPTTSHPCSRPNTWKTGTPAFATPGRPSLAATLKATGQRISWSAPTKRADDSIGFEPISYHVWRRYEVGKGITGHEWTRLTGTPITETYYDDNEFDGISTRNAYYAVVALDSDGRMSEIAPLSVSLPSTYICSIPEYSYVMDDIDGAPESDLWRTLSYFFCGFYEDSYYNPISSAYVEVSNSTQDRWGFFFFNYYIYSYWNTDTGALVTRDRPGNQVPPIMRSEVALGVQYCSGSSVTLELYAVLDDEFDPRSGGGYYIYWDDRPTNLELVDTQVISSSSDYVAFDVSDYVREAVLLRRPNFGFVVKVADTSYGHSVQLAVGYTEAWNSGYRQPYNSSTKMTVFDGLGAPAAPSGFVTEVAHRDDDDIDSSNQGLWIKSRWDDYDPADWVRGVKLYASNTPTSGFASAGVALLGTTVLTKKIDSPLIWYVYAVALGMDGSEGAGSTKKRCYFGTASATLSPIRAVNTALPGGYIGSDTPVLSRNADGDGEYTIFKVNMPSLPSGSEYTQLNSNEPFGLVTVPSPNLHPVTRVYVRKLNMEIDETDNWEDVEDYVDRKYESYFAVSAGYTLYFSIEPFLVDRSQGRTLYDSIIIQPEPGQFEFGCAGDSFPSSIQLLYGYVDTGFAGSGFGALRADQEAQSGGGFTASAVIDHDAYVVEVETYNVVPDGDELPAPPPGGAEGHAPTPRGLTGEESEAIIALDNVKAEITPRGTGYVPVLMVGFDVSSVFPTGLLDETEYVGRQFGAFQALRTNPWQETPTGGVLPTYGLRRLWLEFQGYAIDTAGEIVCAIMFAWDHVENRWRFINRGRPFIYDDEVAEGWIDLRSVDYELSRFVGSDSGVSKVWLAVVPMRRLPLDSFKLVTDYVGLRVEFDLRVYAGSAYISEESDDEWYILFANNRVVPAADTGSINAAQVVYREIPGVFAYLSGEESGSAHVMDVTTKWAKVKVAEGGTLHWAAFGH
jgi:hypothetical protein